jgi:hypothetical protein
MLTLLPLGSAAQPQSPRGIQLHSASEGGELVQERITYRTAVFAAVSETNKPINGHGSRSAQKEARDYYLTVEYVTDVACLLGIWRVLGPALRPFRKYFVRNSTFGVPFQPEAECESRVRINAITGGAHPSIQE